ncbi:alpha/beta fold hydrolase [Oceanomicrobium pacificus]|uniref:Alpha/beta fold hydrolase n=1 Tax=Oceanomicrobium pacificus TaxID=2692916 RepID=A0A6B0TQK0_9RHOB|nr:alpha/beta fold hydrolase [Oceanomicrobium pacificus]MXU64048.1 alpha/beta fold hydrolase [Oceanomicrobium pacificus]
MTELLERVRAGEGQGKPLVIAHGLFGSARNWGVLSKRLSDLQPTVTVDMRNHGQSFHAADNDYPSMAADLGAVIAAEGGRADLLGHSMGGKAAMVLALQAPEAVDRLIVADIAPVAYGHSQRHLIAAMRAVDLSRVSRRSDADAQLQDSVPEPGVRAFLLQSLDLGEGGPRWRFNLDALDRDMDLITGFPEVSGRFDGPTLFLSGGASDYVADDHRAKILDLFPNASFKAMPGLGHWLHAEDPRGFEAEVRAFLSDTPDG